VLTLWRLHECGNADVHAESDVDADAIDADVDVDAVDVDVDGVYAY